MAQISTNSGPVSYFYTKSLFSFKVRLKIHKLRKKFFQTCIFIDFNSITDKYRHEPMGRSPKDRLPKETRFNAFT